MAQVTMVKGEATKFCDQEWQIEANKEAGYEVVEEEKPTKKKSK
jgi:hypothetical protein